MMLSSHFRLARFGVEFLRDWCHVGRGGFVTRKGSIAFSCLGGSEILVDSQFTDRREAPSIVTARRFHMVAQSTYLACERI